MKLGAKVAVLRSLMREAGQTATSKGFNMSFFATYVVSIASEVVETLAHITPAGDPHTDDFIATLSRAAATFEIYRKYGARGYSDQSKIIDEEKMVAELADVIIRTFALAGANGMEDKLIAAIIEKMQQNKYRPEKHDKHF